MGECIIEGEENGWNSQTDRFCCLMPCWIVWEAWRGEPGQTTNLVQTEWLHVLLPKVFTAHTQTRPNEAIMLNLIDKQVMIGWRKKQIDYDI